MRNAVADARRARFCALELLASVLAEDARADVLGGR